ncbi:hypothetical protein [Streptomyces diacarni]|uniref:hypothetical protein n=1 Tax=Streptomyces diacarni TaxID=2800381 RepID=UPI0011C02310|nr:hypothetical protein [Streptomyces diacarni]
MAEADDEARGPEEAERTGRAGLLDYSDEQRESWRVLREQGERRRRRRRVVGWCVTGVLVLGVAGWAAKPTLKDMRIASSACDGAIPDGGMDALRAAAGSPDAHLTESTSETRAELGRYSCEVVSEEERVIEVEVYGRRDDIDRELSREFEDQGGRPRVALPGGLPGFEGQMSTVRLMPSCPGRGKDAAGHRGQLLVSVSGGHPGRPHHLLRAGVAVANKAAAKLGCDAKPLPLPEQGAQPKGVRLAAAAHTSCAALAEGPLKGSAWTADLRIPDGPAPMASCEVRPSGTDEDGDPHAAVVTLYGWYGDFSRRLRLFDARTNKASTDREQAGPWLTEANGWALARCEGQAAGFQITVRRPGKYTGPESTTVDRDQLGKDEMLAMLSSFAKKESAARGCEDLRLPTRP